MIFHPDKQLEDRTRETASKKFLDIQKAYEGEYRMYLHAWIKTDVKPLFIVLSDPFLR